MWISLLNEFSSENHNGNADLNKVKKDPSAKNDYSGRSKN